MYTGYPKTINEQIAAYESEIIETFDIKVNNVIVAAGQNVLDYMLFTYDQFKTQAPLYRLWSNYAILHGPDFSKAYQAWTTNYKPLENYNSDETNVYLTQDGVITDSTTHGKSTTTTANAVTNETQVTTADDTTYRPDSKNVQSGSTTAADSGTDTTTTTHTQTTLTVDGTEYTADKITGEIKSKSGNIGVTTSQQMLQSEVDLRLNPLVIQYIDMFMREYTYYVGGEFCDYYTL